jgi:hypothetical protein
MHFVLPALDSCWNRSILELKIVSILRASALFFDNEEKKEE